jgi:AcrR family transcriptional regulator
MDALIELMAQKDFEKITINEIAEKANVNRGTIYLHFVDKYALLNECVEVSLTSLAEHCSPGREKPESAKASIIKTFEYMENHAFLYSTLLKNSGIPTFRNQLTKMMHQNFEMQIDLSGSNGDIPKDIYIQFFASAAASVFEWWFTNSMPYSPTEITEHLWKLLVRNQLVP